LRELYEEAGWVILGLHIDLFIPKYAWADSVPLYSEKNFRGWEGLEGPLEYQKFASFLTRKFSPKVGGNQR
jgi:hypothetical protein